MKCEQADMWMAQSIFGELDDASAEALELRQHLDSCATCREKLADMRITAGLLADAVQAPPVPQLSSERRQAVLEQAAHPAPRVFVLRIPVRPLAIAASLAIVGLTAWLVLRVTERQAARVPTLAQTDKAALTEIDEMRAEGPAELGIRTEREALVLGHDVAVFYAQPRGGWDTVAVADHASAGRNVAAARPTAGLVGGGVKLRAVEPGALDQRQLAESQAPAGALADTQSLPAPSEAPSRPAPKDYINQLPSRARAAESDQPSPGPEQAAGLPQARLFRGVQTNRVIPTEQLPASQIALVDDRASLDLSQQYINNGVLPPPNAVRVEAFYNNFRSSRGGIPEPSRSYGLKTAAQAEPVTLKAAAGPSVFGSPTLILKIDVVAPPAPADQTSDRQTPTIARDAKLRVEFNASRVCKYRLIGYEDHILAERDDQGQASGGELRAGQTITALYEIELLETSSESDLGVALLRFKNERTGRPHQMSLNLSSAIIAPRTPASDPDFYLASGAARFAELLRGPHPPPGPELKEVESVLEQVWTAAPQEPATFELLNLVRAAQVLPPAP